MLFRFFPQEFKFFDLLEEQADYAVAAAVFFKEVVAKGELTVDDLSKMRDIEHRGDEAAHAIIDRLNRTFITPFDREDIYALTKELDDITDMLYTIVRRLSRLQADRRGQEPGGIRLGDRGFRPRRGAHGPGAAQHEERQGHPAVVRGDPPPRERRRHDEGYRARGTLRDRRRTPSW